VPKRGGKKAKDGHAHAPDEDDAPLLLDRKPTRNQSPFLGEPELQVASSSKKKELQPAEDNSDTEDDDEDLLLGGATSSKKPAGGHQAPPTPARSTSPPPTKRAKRAPSGDEDGDIDMMDDAPIDAGRAPGRIIGNTDPLKDFKKNLRQGDVVTKAVEDMSVVIIEVVLKPFAKRRHEEMMECMKELRRVSLEEDEIEAWNA
jgi:ATP-dependent DNA helicase 2 subunit 2